MRATVCYNAGMAFETRLTPENLLKARRMCEAFDEHAEECAA